MKSRMIEIDAHIAETLAARAAARGLTVRELVADLATREAHLSETDQIEELERRWQLVEDAGTVPHDEVVRWLDTWGTSGFAPWPTQ